MMFVRTQQAVCYYSSKQCDTFTKVEMLGDRAKKEIKGQVPKNRKE